MYLDSPRALEVGCRSESEDDPLNTVNNDFWRCRSLEMCNCKPACRGRRCAAFLCKKPRLSKLFREPLQEKFSSCGD